MVWFRVDDNLALHPKALAAGNAAMGLWVRAGAWSAQQLQEGFVPTDVVTILGNTTQARRLVAAGLWTLTEKDGRKGYRFHDWDERNPSRERVENDRRAAAERQARARDRARESRRDTPTTSRRDSRVTDGVSHGPPDPTRPDPREGGARTTTTRPPATCPRHPHGTDQPCGPCAIARRAHNTWQPPTPIPPTLAQRRAELARLTAMEDTA